MDREADAQLGSSSAPGYNSALHETFPADQVGPLVSQRAGRAVGVLAPLLRRRCGVCQTGAGVQTHRD